MEILIRKDLSPAAADSGSHHPAYCSHGCLAHGGVSGSVMFRYLTHSSRTALAREHKAENGKRSLSFCMPSILSPNSTIANSIGLERCLLVWCSSMMYIGAK